MFIKYKQLKSQFYKGPKALGRMPLARFMPYKTLTYVVIYWLMFYVQKYLTLAGVILMTSTVFVLVYSAYSYEALATTYLGYCGVGILVVNIIVGWFFRPRVKIFRKMADVVFCGEVSMIYYQIENQRCLPLYDLFIDPFFYPGMQYKDEGLRLGSLSPGNRTELKTEVTFNIRGEHYIPHCSVDSGFPFNLWKWNCRGRGQACVTVLPECTPIDYLDLPDGMLSRIKGDHYAIDDGSGMEFQACRPYREGDNLRHIHWFSYARTGIPVVREYGGSSQAKISFFFDNACTRSIHDNFELWQNVHYESVVSFCGGLVTYLNGMDIIVENLYLGSQVYQPASKSGNENLDDVLKSLAKMEEVRRKKLLEFDVSNWNAVMDGVGIVMVLTELSPEAKQMIKDCCNRDIAAKIFLITRQSTEVEDLPVDISVIGYDQIRGGFSE